MDEEILVSIVVPVYNHEKYIKKALESILFQKVNFNYEVLIAEDCSSDNSRNILMNLEKTYPNNFKFIYRNNNYGIVRNISDLYSRMKGKYYILLEGDDYWTYEYKLQKQVDFLEENKEYLAVCHNTIIVDENDNVRELKYPECKNSEYTIKDFRNGLLPGQSTSIMFKNYFKYSIFDYDVRPVSYPGDRRKAFLLAANGKTKCIQESWSAYRYVTTTGSSYSANANKYESHTLDFYKSLIEYSERTNKDEDIIIACKELYAWQLVVERIKMKKGNFEEIHSYVKNSGHAVKLYSFILGKVIKYPFAKVKTKFSKTI